MRSFPSLLLGLALFSSPVLEAQTTVDALHYKLEIELFFNTKTIQGRTTATFKSLTNNLKSVDLDLLSKLKVTKVSMGTKTLSFTRPSNRIHVFLDRAYNSGETFTFSVDYGGAPPRGAGWGGLVFTSHSGSPLAWTLSEPWDARAWWPGKDQLGDKATFEIWITHPNTMTAASNGKLQGIDTLSGNRLRTRWAENYPMIPYLASLAVTNYKKRVDTYTYPGGSMPVEFYVFPEYYASWQSGMNLIVPMLKTFSSVYGQYPFINEKYGIAQFTWGGGMEHQTITSQVSVSEWLSAHELAHQWWGDAVTCKTWSDIWLNEGFATFSEALYFEKKPGGSLAAYHNWIRRRKPYAVNGTVYIPNPTSVGRIFNGNYTYRKGGWVLHQLRHVLGDTMFFKCLLAYRKAYEGKSATTADFQAVCETTSGRSLKWFFDEWVYKGGAPNYRYAWKNQVLNGKNWLLLELAQTQSLPQVTIMPVDVRTVSSKGTRTHVVWNDERKDAFAIPMNAPATSVAVDPDQWILRTGLYRTTFTTPFFASDGDSIDTTKGGAVDFVLLHSSSAARRPYLLLSGASGTTPGTKVFGLTVPLNFDGLTNLGLAALNTPIFQGFFGKLDASGGAVATFRLPAGLGTVLKGKVLHFAALLPDRFDWVSRPIRIALD